MMHDTRYRMQKMISDEGHLSIESTTASGTEYSEARSIPTAEFQGGFYAMDIPEYKFTFSVSYSISAWGDDSLSEISYQVIQKCLQMHFKKSLLGRIYVKADLNGNKEVNVDDLEMFAIDFGRTDCR